MLSPRIKIVSSPTPHFSLQSTPASRHELSARKVETVIHEIHQDIHALLAGTDTERDIFQNRKIALRNALDRLSVLIINMTPTEQRRMLQYWESRNPEFWDTLCILGYDDQWEPKEALLNRNGFEKLPHSQHEIQDTQGNIVHEKIFIRERVLLTLIGGISMIDIARAFHQPFIPSTTWTPPFSQNSNNPA